MRSSGMKPFVLNYLPKINCSSVQKPELLLSVYLSGVENILLVREESHLLHRTLFY